MLMLMWITALIFHKTDSAQENQSIIQPDSMVIADVGDSVTLRCFRPEEETSGSIIWYKQKVGHEPRAMVTVNYEPIWENQFKSPRFCIKKEKRGFHLNIANLEPSDEAMYYCSLMKFSPVFGKGTFLTVKDDRDVKVSVWQHGMSDSVPAGASVTLQCSVLSESRAAELQVLWFRAAPPQSHPQIIYTHHNSSHQCESGSSTHTCVYNFTKNILSLNDTGTYYCAVALCGKIVFGNGTQIQLGKKTLTDQCFKGSDAVMICLAVALVLCVVVISVQVSLNCKNQNFDYHMVKVSQDTMHNQDDDTVEVNYTAIN
ncbi:immunoglobulin kappa light chain-like [Hemibagrus wyckioides]|uniref:immunoglobulin kappa light chain-like n=1 Tax=Hemibagrus wyckioides TaxID=337641 RepID=UPI00266DC6E1|nr:immunoglobulin kappa light chain-like [Hemibagrus wyckioides]XP_058254036.1 immunoglobulin kappa light chain-like [Hemibagrus wyckioides]